MINFVGGPGGPGGPAGLRGSAGPTVIRKDELTEFYPLPKVNRYTAGAFVWCAV